MPPLAQASPWPWFTWELKPSKKARQWFTILWNCRILWLPLVMTRASQRFPSRSLTSFKEKIYEEVLDIEGKLIVKEYPTKTASTQTIRNHLEKLKMRDINVDLIIIDYGDLLRPVRYLKEKRNELESIYEELRGIAAEYEAPVWTASQTNRSGLNAEVITMESISEAFNKCFVADFIFSISRTIDDKVANGGRLFVAKNRNGPDGLVFPSVYGYRQCVH